MKESVIEEKDTQRPELQDKTQNKGKSFAAGLNFYKLFWIFIAGSIAGYVLETLFCLVTEGRLESRQGLIYGPFSQVYGFGAVLFTLCMRKSIHWPVLPVFLICAVLGGAFEYLCSIAEQYILGVVSWNYNLPLSINGRTNALYCILWGTGGVFLVKVVYPRFSSLIERIPNSPGIVVTWVLVVLISLDCIISAAAIERQTQRLSNIPAKTTIGRVLDHCYPDSTLKRIYPNLQRGTSQT